MYHMYHINRAEFPDRKNSWSLYIFPWERVENPTAYRRRPWGQDLAEVFGLETFEVGGPQKVTVSNHDSTMD